MKKFYEFLEEELVEAKDDQDEGEYDYEGDMAKQQLRAMIIHAKRMLAVLEDGTNLPEWLQSKITLAHDYVMTAGSYLEAEDEEGDLDESTDHTQERSYHIAQAAKAGITIAQRKAHRKAADLHGMAAKDYTYADAARKASAALKEEVEQIDEISDDAKKRYVKAARDDVYHRFTGRGKYEKPRNPDNFTKTGRPKKSVLNSPASVKYRAKLDQRNAIIAKTKKDLGDDK